MASAPKQTEIQKTEPAKPPSLVDLIRERQSSFADVATKYLSPERLVKLALVAVTKMPDLQKVPGRDIIAELITCSRLGLEPNVEGGRWLLPFKRNTDQGVRWEVVGVTDYRGLIDVARRSGEVLSIHADVRREHDLWEFWVQSDGPTLVHLRHRPAEGDRGAILGAFAIVRLRNGEVQAEYRTLEQINDAKARSRGADSKFSPWQRDFEAMAKKTAVRRLYNFLPKTPEIQAAREALAEEEERDRATEAIDVTPAPAPSASRAAALKQRLRAQTQGTASDAAGLDKEFDEQHGDAPEPTPPEGDEPGSDG